MYVVYEWSFTDDDDDDVQNRKKKIQDESTLEKVEEFFFWGWIKQHNNNDKKKIKKQQQEKKLWQEKTLNENIKDFIKILIKKNYVNTTHTHTKKDIQTENKSNGHCHCLNSSH